MYHCSCTVRNGLYSFFMTSTREAARHALVEQELKKKTTAQKQTKPDNTVYIYKKGELIRLATVVGTGKENSTLQIIYNSRFKKKGILTMKKEKISLKKCNIRKRKYFHNYHFYFLIVSINSSYHVIIVQLSDWCKISCNISQSYNIN